MADEEINVLFSLEDQFTKPIKSVTNRIKDFQVKVKETKNIVNSFGKDADGIFIKVAKDASKMGTALSNSISKSGMNKAMELVLNNQTSALQGFWSTATATSQTALEQIQGMSENTIAGVGSMLEELKNTIQTVAYASSELQAGGISNCTTSATAGAKDIGAKAASDLNEKTNTSDTATVVSESKGTLEKISSAASAVGKALGSAKSIAENINGIKSIVKPTEKKSDGESSKAAEKKSGGKSSKAAEKKSGGKSSKAAEKKPGGESSKAAEKKSGGKSSKAAEKKSGGKSSKAIENKSDGGSLVKLIGLLESSQGLATAVGGLTGNIKDFSNNITSTTTGAFSTGTETVSELNSNNPSAGDTAVNISDSNGMVDNLSTAADATGNVKTIVENLSKAYGFLNKEKLKDIAETLYLKALYAGDFLKSIGSSTVEVLKNTGAWIVNKAQLLAQKAGLLALKGVQLISQGVTAGLTAAQWALNAAFIASPVGWVVLGILALVAVGVLLYNNWDTIKEKASELWGKVQEVFGGIKDFVVGVFQSVMSTVGPIIDGLMEKIQPILDKVHEFIEAIKENPVVEAFISGWDTVKDKVTGIISSNATGTPYFKGGLTHINEGGRGEIVNLPNGTQIIPHDISKRQNSQPIVNVSVNVQGNLIGNNEYANYIGGVVARRVVAAYGNM